MERVCNTMQNQNIDCEWLVPLPQYFCFTCISYYQSSFMTTIQCCEISGDPRYLSIHNTWCSCRYQHCRWQHNLHQQSIHILHLSCQQFVQINGCRRTSTLHSNIHTSSNIWLQHDQWLDFQKINFSKHVHTSLYSIMQSNKTIVSLQTLTRQKC